MKSVIVDPQSPRRLITALKRLESAAEASSREAAHSVARDVADAKAELARREGALREARTRLEQARAALNACLASRNANCSGAARAVQGCESAVRTASQRVQAAKDAVRIVSAKQTAFEAARRRWLSNLKQYSESAVKELSVAADRIEKYLAGSVPSGRTATGRGGHTGAGLKGYTMLAKMLAPAALAQVEDLVAETADFTTAHMADPLGSVVSGLVVAGHEVHQNWDLYRLTPEMLTLRLHDLLRQQ